MKKEYYDVQDVIDAGFTLEPIKCRDCDSLDVTFNQYIGDANCNYCGEWQLKLKRKEITNE